MADRDMLSNGADDAAKLKEEKRRFKEEQKNQKKKQAQQRKEAKKKAKEIAAREEAIADDDEGTAPVILTTLVIVLVWVGIICALIKLDVGGFGSGVLAPILKNVPVLNMILPDESTGNISSEDGEDVDVAGYESLREAVAEIEDLEEELIDYQEELNAKNERILALEEEIERLETFEDMQVEFERIKTEFYNEVVYSEKGPGEEAYKKYYEAMDPATAEVLYKQVIAQIEEDEEIKNYAQAYSEMKPKEAAGIFEAMTDNLKLAARILGEMEPDERGAILGVMDPEVAAKITKIMEPDS